MQNKKNPCKFNNEKTSKINIICLNVISLLLFIASYYFYYLSLEKCLDGEDVCCKRWKWIFRKIKQLIISIILLIFLFFLINWFICFIIGKLDNIINSQIIFSYI